MVRQNADASLEASSDEDDDSRAGRISERRYEFVAGPTPSSASRPRVRRHVMEDYFFRKRLKKVDMFHTLLGPAKHPATWKLQAERDSIPRVSKQEASSSLTWILCSVGKSASRAPVSRSGPRGLTTELPATANVARRESDENDAGASLHAGSSPRTPSEATKWTLSSLFQLSVRVSSTTTLNTVRLCFYRNRTAVALEILTPACA
jgi:hypothetical protein